jgi:hypothetical protein
VKHVLKLQPSTMGFGLFGLAATILCAMIISSHSGLTALTLMLGNVAQPTCAAAIAVLMYLAIVTRRVERSLEN